MQSRTTWVREHVQDVKFRFIWIFYDFIDSIFLPFFKKIAFALDALIEAPGFQLNLYPSGLFAYSATGNPPQ